MERTIRVLVESTHSVHTFTTSAATLGELKEEFRQRDIPFSSDSEFHEARSKAIYTSDNAPLPTNIPWRGEITNDLTFKIMTSHRKIESGAGREELYALIKNYGLGELISENEGKNFTQCSNNVLSEYISNYENANKEETHYDEEETLDLDDLRSYMVYYLELDEEDADKVVEYIIAHFGIKENTEYNNVDSEFED